MSAFDQLDILTATITEREGGDPSQSYIAKKLGKGKLKLAQKVGEEAVETAIAAASDNREGVISESADLLFHLLLLWRACGVEAADVMDELKRREGKSGLAEKAARGDE